MHALDQISHTIRKLDYFSLSRDLEIDSAITYDSVINRFSQLQEWFYNLTRQDETDPHAEHKGESGNNTECPFGLLNELACLPMILLDEFPVAGF